MQSDTTILYCSNPGCQVPNAETDAVCQSCQTPLVKRYLWQLGSTPPRCQPGEVVGDRYRYLSDRIYLETQPGRPPFAPVEVPSEIETYLRLIPYHLHLPQVYGLLAPSLPDQWLLEHVPLYAAHLSDLPQEKIPVSPQPTVKLRPQLSDRWGMASALRQLNWLWQMANLWQPLREAGVASSLFNPKLLRVEGSLLQLLELQADPAATSLSALGSLWQSWLPATNPEIAPWFTQHCQTLITQADISPDWVVEQIDQQLRGIGNPHPFRLQMATATDQGPSRHRNEDASYPEGGSFEVTNSDPDRAATQLLLVCDGVGGHEGGGIASQLAVECIHKQLQPLQSAHQSSEKTDVQTVISALDAAVRLANDQISDRNDREQRQDRQRMGTTVVMAWLQAPELYITHLGDSRAYWIRPTSCHQLTWDDDVASREVRLGYALYRDALRWPAAGSLIQALGMGSSSLLYPTVQRFILDEESLLLLCSDGLSDNDRVEQYWETALLPIFTGAIDLKTAARQLIDLANTQNGHDNVTVGLLHYQPHGNASDAAPPVVSTTFPSPQSFSMVRSPLSPAQRSKQWNLRWLLLGTSLVLVGWASLLISLTWETLKSKLQSPPLPTSPVVLPSSDISPSPAPH
ncbi:PP2C family protein-serine/threonine phosphatase [Neosynechococcus sphagnicola]|uniref:PP2C family protein-serine/threonine phosphatase n=1 Tax=Neosynechococcus sphagnicola TaxID=1501145 RepID=UPI000690B9C9|nr:protein phosphatase 2C domain-containing protein [Neosynechococcus sphagnicola]